MSATSRVGRGIRKLFPAFLFWFWPERVEGALRAGNQFGGYFGVPRRGVDAGVAQQHLDDPRVGTVFEKMSRKAVPQCMAGDTLGQAALFCCVTTCIRQRRRRKMPVLAP